MGIIYGLDPAGNIVQMVDQLSLNRSQSFGYDLVDRLISAEGMYGEEAYTYDLVGNRLGKTETNGSTTTDTYSYSLTSNRLTDISGNNPQAITYDATGNIISRGSDTFTYNARNRLAEVTRNGTTLATYQHNGKGERVSKTVHDGTTTTTYFVYDLAGNIIAEADGTGAITREYAYHNERLAMFTYGLTNEIYYYHNDHLGTPKAVTDSTGAVAWQGDYTPFGEVTETVALIEQPFRFPGQYFDEETNLHYNYFRDYDPTLGRYIQSDPIGLQGGINTYLYANANPLIYADPEGLSPAHAARASWSVGTNIGRGFNWTWEAAAGRPLGISIYDWIHGDEASESSGSLNGCPPNPGNKDPCKGLRDELARHKQKLNQYLNDPISMDNKGSLAYALSKNDMSLYNTIYAGRIASLQSQIANFERMLKECEAKYGK